jgi:serine/threonine-protein kinase
VTVAGRLLGSRYQVGELVGQGGMATIYRATDVQLGRDVAIKVLRGEYGVDTATGGDLAAVLRERGPLPAAAAARIGQQIADALDAAHARGIIHRDIKPSNVLLTSGGRVKVADFGIAQAFSDAQLTMTGVTMGSVHYFSPEQARGGTVTTSSDVYSAGLVLYEALTGSRPFAGDSAAAVAMARLTGQVPSPMAVRPDVPQALDAIVRWALQPDPRTLYAPQTAESERGAAGPWGWFAALGGLFVVVLAGVLVFLIITWGTGGAAPSPTPGPTPTPRALDPTPFGAPAFVGLVLGEAEEIADDRGIRLEVRYEESDEEPGTVLGQDPRAGTRVREGDTVELTVAAASDTVRVPELRGATESDAVSALTEADLRPGGRFRTYSSGVAAGLVVRTVPRAGEEVARGTTVDYYLSRGPRPTAGTTPTERPTRAPGITERPATPRPTRRPTPGTRTPEPTVAAPSTPEATFSVVGSYGCLDLATARDRIDADGLSLGDVEPADHGAGWLVVGQQPPAGAQVRPRTGVDLALEAPGASGC